jgi:hypothetical protein
VNIWVRGTKRIDVQTKRFPADGIQQGKRDDNVVWQPQSVLLMRLPDLCTQFLLDVLVFAKDVESAGDRCRGGVGRGESKNPR